MEPTSATAIPAHDDEETRVDKHPTPIYRCSLKRIALVALSVVLVVVVPTVIYLSVSARSRPPKAVPTNRTTACEFATPLFPKYQAHSLDEMLGTDQEFVTDLIITMSRDATQLAVATAEWKHKIRLIDSLGLEQQPQDAVEFIKVDVSEHITHMALSGDGSCLLIGGEINSVMYDTANQKSIPFENVITDFVIDYTISDVAVNWDCTMFAIGYGSSDQKRASFDQGDAWEADNITYAMTLMYDLTQQDGNNQEWSYTASRFTYQTDNYGTQLAMDSSGTIVYHSSEHDNQLHHASPDIKEKNVGWAGQSKYFKLGGLCTNATSDVAASNDGRTVIIGLQCWQKGDDSYTLYLYPFVANSTDYSSWITDIEPVVRILDVNSLKPMSLSMSGDGSLTVLTIEGLSMEVLQGKFWEDIDASATSSITSEASTKVSVEISDGASFVVVATADTLTGGSVCLFTSIDS